MSKHTERLRKSSECGAFVRFLKNWTLPVSMTTGAAIYILFSSITSIEAFTARADAIITAIFPFVMMTILFATFCRVDFRSLRLGRWHVLLLLCQIMLIVVFVIIAHILSSRFSILSEALLVCIAAPCAAAAPVVTGKLGGNVEGMTAYTMLSNVASACMIPIVFTLMPQGTDISVCGWSLFLHLMRSTALVLLLPLALAWGVKHYAPRLHSSIISIHDLPFYLWAFSLSIVSGLTVKHVLHAGASATLLAQLAVGSLLVCLLQFRLGHAVGQLCGVRLEAGQGLGQKNTAFAIWLAMTHLTPVGSVAPGCYILWQNIINSMEIAARRHLTNKATGNEAPNSEKP